MYGNLHYAEAAQVTLDPDSDLAVAQFDVLAQKYFRDSFQLRNGVWTRLDPGDGGADYRNVIGIPGGVHGIFYESIVTHNINNMTLLEGGVHGVGGDAVDNGVVYVYDSVQFPFYRAEQYHQYHANVVLGRPVPQEYLVTAKASAVARNWIPLTCNDANHPNPGTTNVENATTRCPVVIAEHTFSPTSPAPTSDAPVSFAPVSFAPTTLAQVNHPTSISPTTITPTTLSPVTNAPTTAAPSNTLAPFFSELRAPSLAQSGSSSSDQQHQVLVGVIVSFVLAVVVVVIVIVLRKRSAGTTKYAHLDQVAYEDSGHVASAFDQEMPQSMPLDSLDDMDTDA